MKSVDIVCYTSKLCNLRCRYCYELPMLSDRTRMSFEQIERMFTNVDAGYRGHNEPLGINFQWHGGEPLLIPPEIYRRIFEIQRSVFAGSIHRVTNSTQSNFTVMDEDRIALLRDFDHVGISLDLFTGLRVNGQGVCQESRALDNLKRVRAAGIAVGGITVLTRRNAPRVREIYNFYREQRMGFRVLPLEKGLYPEEHDFSLGPREVLEAYRTLSAAWLEDDDPVEISPLDRYLFLVVHANFHPENRVGLHDPLGWASVLLVDTDGSVYTYGERFERSVGNLFTTPLDSILASREYHAAAAAVQGRMHATCDRCPSYGRSCTGDPIGQSAQDYVEQEDDGSTRCVVAKGIIQHLENQLTEAGLISGGTVHHLEKIFAGRVSFAVD
jgi:uncharacterized protein